MTNRHCHRVPPLLSAALLALLTVLLLSWHPDLYAQTKVWTDPNQFATMLEGIIKFITGPVVRAIAIIAIIGVLLIAFAGRMDWNIAIRIVLGIVIIFAAAAIFRLVNII